MRRRLVSVALLALLVPSAAVPGTQARFMDPLPDLYDPVLSVARTSGFHLAGHQSGLLVAMDDETGSSVWSQRVESFPLTSLLVTDGRILLGQTTNAGDAGWLSALTPGNGSITYSHFFTTGIVGLDADAGLTALVTVSGNASRLQTSDGSALWTKPLGAHGQAAAVANGAIIAATAGTLHLLDATNGDALATTNADAVKLAAEGTHVWAVLKDGSLKHWDIGGNTFTPATTPTFTSPSFLSISAAHDRVVAGDTQGALHTFTLDGATVLPPIYTYANAVNDVDLISADETLAAFRSGWVGVVPLRDQPIVLALWPQPDRFVTTPLAYEWAYAHPTANDGDTVTHTLQVRPVGENDWRTISTGTSPVGRVTRLRSVDVDLAAFPSGTRLQTRIEVKAADGAAGEDIVSTPFLLDHEPPNFVGTPSPTPGQIVRVSRPSILVGHRDAHSGIEPRSTEFQIDGGDVGWTIERYRSYTRATPTFDLGEGTHTWSLRFEDAARNWRDWTANFTVDTRPAAIVSSHVDALAQTAVAISYTTDEPARCNARVVGGPAAAPERETRLQHVAFIVGLSPATTYQLQTVCVDNAARSVTLSLPEITTKAKEDRPAPKLTLQLQPGTPDGADSWFTSPLSAATLVEPAGTPIYWSLDQAAFEPWTAPLEIPSGIHQLRLFAITPDGSTSDLIERELKVDATAPPEPQVIWTPTLPLLAWDEVADPDSGTLRFEVEGRTGPDQAWQLLPDGSIAWPGHRFTEVATGLHSLRVTAVNGAGTRTPSRTIDTGFEVADVIYSLAGVVNQTVPRDEYVLVNVRLGPSARFEQAYLVDSTGRFHPFSSERTIGPRLHQAFAKAENFQPGTYRALVEVADRGTKERLEAGTVELLSSFRNDTAAPSNGPSKGPPVERIPTIDAALVLLAFGCAFATRRRRGQ